MVRIETPPTLDAPCTLRNRMKRPLYTLPLYPFLFAAWAILQLWIINSVHLVFADVIGLLLAALGVLLALVVGLALLFRDLDRAGALAGLLSLMFFTYGQVDLVLRYAFSGTVRHVLLPIWGAILLIGLLALWRVEKVPALAALPANVMGVVLIGFAISSAARFGIRASAPPGAEVPLKEPIDVDALSYDPDALPDIYYIVLDEYGRADVLLDRYGLDNRPFLDALEGRGFYVAEDSRSNYSLTFMSLAASLNLGYLPEIGDLLRAESDYYTLVYDRVDRNEVTRALQEMGYTYIHFNSGWGPTNRPSHADVEVRFRGISEYNFPGLVTRATMMNALYPALLSQGTRGTILHNFERIGDLAALDTPTFVFAHIVTPHPPYVFLRDGSPVPLHDVAEMMNRWPEPQFEPAYVEQVQFANAQVLETVDRILAQSDRPPIIVVQSDHGTMPPGMLPGATASYDDAVERSRILNAYYLPDGGDALLYPTITPVNTFRVIFDRYFGEDFGLLEDHAYFSTYRHPDEVYEVVD
jgi:hypothetical protein